MQLRSIFVLLASVSAIKIQTAPDVSALVAEESAENIQIHDGFQTQENQDVKKEKQVKADRDLSALQLMMKEGSWMVALEKDMKTEMLVQVGGIKDPCESIPCAGSLKCPSGFQPESIPGHCCDYCVNPNIEVKPEVTGATGSHGGKISTFCPKVFCFPTMCSSTATAATTTNGQCCGVCS